MADILLHYHRKKSANIYLGDNRDIALNRLHKLVKRLSLHDGQLQRYDMVIRQYPLLGHTELVPEKILTEELSSICLIEK